MKRRQSTWRKKISFYLSIHEWLFSPKQKTITGIKIVGGERYSTWTVTFRTCDLNFKRVHMIPKKKPKQLEASVIHLQLFGTSCTLRKNETKKAPRCFSVNTKMMKNRSFLVGHVMWHDRVLSTERKSDDLNSLTAKSLTYGTTSMRAIHHFQSIRTSRFVILQFKVETFKSDQIIMQLQFNFSP